jgi:hypothetical protein
MVPSFNIVIDKWLRHSKPTSLLTIIRDSSHSKNDPSAKIASG